MYAAIAASRSARSMIPSSSTCAIASSRSAGSRYSCRIRGTSSPPIAPPPARTVGALYIPNSYGKFVPPGVAYRVLSSTCRGYANRVFNGGEPISAGPGMGLCALSVIVYPQAQQP